MTAVEETCNLDSDAFAAIVVSAATPPASDLAGTLLDGRYELLERIGSGGMGIVYRARHVKLGRIVAIKIVKVPLRDVGTSSKRFENEAMAMARLDHPNCASIVDSGTLGRRAYVVMDFVSGTDLATILDGGPLEPARAVAIVRQVLAGLAHAHARGIVHRDIKPANLLISQQPGLGDHVKIVDFGLARFREGHTDLTRGLVVGTPSYMAPEQIRGRTIDARADIYSCGIVLFELLAGKVPYSSANGDALEILTKHITRPVPLLSEVTGKPELAVFDQVIARAIAKDPLDRYASATDLADALAAIGAPAPAEVEPSTSVVVPPRSRRGFVATVAAVALLLAAGVGFAMHALDRDDAVTPPVVAAPIVAPVPVPEPPPVVVDPRIGLARKELELGRAYFDEMRWTDGVKQLRRAIALDASLRENAALIQIVLRGFVTTTRYNATVGSFLRKELGAAAIPELERIARTHRNPIVRKRAASEIRALAF